MRTENAETDECSLCERELSSSAAEIEDGRAFCSTGCLNVHSTLNESSAGEGDSKPAFGADESINQQRPVERSAASSDGIVRTFLRIDGMYSATDEAFLESVAEKRDGVIESQASYVTETIRVEHDPDQVSKTDLRDTLSTLGYTAYLREVTSESTQQSGSTTRRSREMTGMRKRRDEQFLELRYAAGLLFGAFLMVPYVALIYPPHLAAILDWEILRIFAGAFQLDTLGGLIFLRLYFVLTGIILIFTGLPVLRGAYVSLKMRRPNADLLVAVTAISAYVYSTASVLLGRNDIFFDLTLVIAATVTTVLFYEAWIKKQALTQLTELTISQVDSARVLEADGTTHEVPVNDLTPGDRILVRQGERIPVDGVLVESECTIDEAVVTGESLPIRKQTGDEVIGGSVVTDDAAVIRVGDQATSSIDRITTAVWNLQSAEHGIQRYADRLSSRTIPILIGLATIVGMISVALGRDVAVSALVGLMVVFVGSPWVLSISGPLSVARSLEECLERGIVVFDETIFERLRGVDTVVFDKTGTLTTGEMKVIEADAPGDLLNAVAALERRASHPVANAIVTAFANEENGPDPSHFTGDSPDDDSEERVNEVDAFQTTAGGIVGVVDGREILVGNLDLFSERGWAVSEEIETQVENARGFGRLPVIIGREGTAEGIIIVGDEPRDGWKDVFTRLSEQGTDIVVLTGDDESATDFFRQHSSVKYVFASVPPTGKTATIHQLKSNGQVAMVGDGTNDAPAIAAADLGISLGSGTAVAADAADIAIIDDDIRSVRTAFDLAHAAGQRVKQNDLLALLYNVVAIPVAIAGLLNPLTAMLAVLTSLGLISVNCSRKLLDK